jgi:hypothetical protein
MPDVWDTEIYRARAEAWRHKAGEFPEGSPRGGTVSLSRKVTPGWRT